MPPNRDRHKPEKKPKKRLDTAQMFSILGMKPEVEGGWKTPGLKARFLKGYMRYNIKQKPEVDMTRKMEYDLFAARKRCNCGNGLVYDGSLMVCVGCYDVFCPSCFNRAVAEGGCFACAVCGWSACM